MSSLHTVRVIVTAYDQSNHPFDGWVTAKLGVPIESTATLNEYVTQLQVQRAEFVEGIGILEIIPSTLLGDDSYYVFQIVRKTPETVLLEAAASVPDEDCELADLVDLNEYNLTTGNLSTTGLNLKSSDKQKFNKLINEVRLAKVSFKETSDALIAETEAVSSQLSTLQADVDDIKALRDTVLEAVATLTSHTEAITSIQTSLTNHETHLNNIDTSITAINQQLSNNYSFITTTQITNLFTETPSEPEYYSHYLFFVSGQSNASGSGNQGASRGYAVGSFGYSYDWKANSSTYGRYIPVKDPVYAGGGDSAWPWFCDKFYALTGKTPLIVNIASGGACVTTFAGTTTTNSWANDGIGTLRASRGPVILDALNRAKVDSFQYRVGGILWCQGCAEGGRITNGYVTANDYKQATKDIWAWTRNVIGKVYAVPVFVSQIGWSSGCFTGSNAANVYAGYEAVQNAQVELCNDASLNAFMGFDQAKNFYDPQNYRMDSGGIHYTQEGYKEMGEALAVKAVQVLNIELLPTVEEGD